MSRWQKISFHYRLFCTFGLTPIEAAVALIRFTLRTRETQPQQRQSRY